MECRIKKTSFKTFNEPKIQSYLDKSHIKKTSSLCFLFDDHLVRSTIWLFLCIKQSTCRNIACKTKTYDETFATLRHISNS